MWALNDEERMSVVKTPEENIFNKQLNSEQEKLELS